MPTEIAVLHTVGEADLLELNRLHAKPDVCLVRRALRSRGSSRTGPVPSWGPKV